MKLKQVLYIIISLIAVNGAMAQQNFFNVPSSDITPKGSLFFQQQVNFLSESMQFNSTFSYGLGSDWECGFNVLGLTRDNVKGFINNDSSVPYAPMFCFNAQKKLIINEEFSLAGGTQLGLNTSGSLSSYVYANSIIHLHESHTKIVAGMYYSSDGFFGSEQRGFFQEGFGKNIGFQLGFEQQLIAESLVLQSDLITGKHDLGENVTGLAYYLTPTWILSGGYQLPLFNSTSQKAFVVELTYSPEQ